MDEYFLLILVVIFLVCIFAMVGLRMWWILHTDAAISRKVNGLSIDMGKVKKALRESLTPAVTQNTSMPDMSSMTLEDAAESIGIDASELNNPLIRPLAEKIFEGIKNKAAGNEDGKTEIIFR